MPKKLFRNLSKTQKLKQYFLYLGFPIVETRSGKYECFFSGTQYYFLGKGAAVRMSQTKTASKSRSMTTEIHRVFQAWADKQNPEEFIEI
jgi:hypothetical protein